MKEKKEGGKEKNEKKKRERKEGGRKETKFYRKNTKSIKLSKITTLQFTSGSNLMSF